MKLDEFCCPRCGGRLKKDFYYGKICYRCTRCNGISASVAMIRSLSKSRDFANYLWQKALKSNSSYLYCPVCRKPMRQIVQNINEDMALELDVCCSCQSVWFDAGELEAVPRKLPEVKCELPQKAREILALEQVKNINEQHEIDEEPGNPWMVIPACLGFPVELNAPKLNSLPIITWLIAATCITVFAYTYNDYEAIKDLGFIPAELFRNGGLNIFSSVFLHGNLAHLIGNIYFLLIFGDNVEDHLGKLRYLGFLFMSLLFSFMAYWVLNIDSRIPCIGASGIISGVIALYAVLFPNVRLSFLISNRYSYRIGLYKWVSIPAWCAFLVWVIFQTIMAFAVEKSSQGGVAYTAHLGGAFFGLAAGIIMLLWNKRKK